MFVKSNLKYYYKYQNSNICPKDSNWQFSNVSYKLIHSDKEVDLSLTKICTINKKISILTTNSILTIELWWAS